MFDIIKTCFIDPLTFLIQIENDDLNENINTIKNNNDGTFTFTFKTGTVATVEPILDQFILDYPSFAANIQPTLYAYDLKMKNLIQSDLIEQPFNTIDFKTQLKPPCTLTKTVNMNNDGRPLNSLYTYNGEVMAEIIYIFRGAPLMTRRTEVLYYKLPDNSNSPPIVIKDKIFDMTNGKDRQSVIHERGLTRKNIINDANGFLLGVIKNITSQDEAFIMNLISPFFIEIEQLEHEYIRLGTSNYIDYISNIDLNTTPYTWLSYETSPGVTIKDYLISRLSYTAQETYINFDYNTIQHI